MSVKRFQLLAMPSVQRRAEDAIRARASPLLLHLCKIFCFPDHPASAHWKTEVRDRLREMHRAQRVRPNPPTHLAVIAPLLAGFDINRLYKKLYQYGSPEQTPEVTDNWLASILPALTGSILSGDPPLGDAIFGKNHKTTKPQLHRRHHGDL